MLRSTSSGGVVFGVLGSWLLTGCGAGGEVHDSTAISDVLEVGLVYDEDSRRDVADCVSEAFSDVALRSTVALVPKSKIRVGDNGQVVYSGPTLRQSLDFCDGELRFESQPTLAECSGVLIGPELVLTGGHCVDDQDQCQATFFVFDYAIPEGGKLELQADDLYECDELLSREVSDMGSAEVYDHAVVRLSRPVDASREPVPIRTTAVVEGDDVVLIGNGAGLPTKVDMDGRVTDGREAAGDYFGAQVDNFERGSGSPVFDSRGRLAGIAVRGGVDYDTKDSCFRVRQVAGISGLSEQISYAHTALERSERAAGKELGVWASSGKGARQQSALQPEECGIARRLPNVWSGISFVLVTCVLRLRRQ